MHDIEIEKLMTPKIHDGKESIPGMKHNLKPHEVKHLGKDVQVWAVHISSVAPKAGGVTFRAAELFSVALYRVDGDTPQTIYLTATDFPHVPSEDKKIYSLGDLLTGRKKRGAVFSGLNVSDFVETIYSHLPKRNKKTRVLLVAFGTSEQYAPLNLHDLDARLTFRPSGGGNFALGFVNKAAGQSLSFFELQNFFPEQDLQEITRAFFLDPDNQTELDTSKGLFTGKTRPKEMTFLSPPSDLKKDDALARAYALEQARLTWRIFSELRRVMLGAFDVDPAVYGTPANCAARAYTSHYLPERVTGARAAYAVRLQAMRSYWGGRMELFFRGQYQAEEHERISVYDAVSLYPQSCINLGSLPLGHSWYRLTRQNLHTCHAGLCSVEFSFPEGELFPCLPVGAGGRTFYPLQGLSHCTVHEVRYAIEKGATIHKISGWVYDAESGDTSLSAFSRDLLEKKNQADQSGDYAARTMYKLLMNSLYGKFGQKYTDDYSLDTLREICRVHFPHLGSVPELLEIMGWEKRVLDNGGEIETAFSTGNFWHPEWVALINGYARFVESKAMSGDYLTLAGTTDSVVMVHGADLAPSFDVEGVTFKREITGDKFTGIRARFYVLQSEGEVVKAALLGAPKMPGVAEKIAAWEVDGKEKRRKSRGKTWQETGEKWNTFNPVLDIVFYNWNKSSQYKKSRVRNRLKKINVSGDWRKSFSEFKHPQSRALRVTPIKGQMEKEQTITVYAPKVEQVKEGVRAGAMIGKNEFQKWEISLKADTGREYMADYSEPLKNSAPLKNAAHLMTDEEKALSQKSGFRGGA